MSIHAVRLAMKRALLARVAGARPIYSRMPKSKNRSGMSGTSGFMGSTSSATGARRRPTALLRAVVERAHLGLVARVRPVEDAPRASRAMRVGHPLLAAVEQQAAHAGRRQRRRARAGRGSREKTESVSTCASIASRHAWRKHAGECGRSRTWCHLPSLRRRNLGPSWRGNARRTRVRAGLPSRAWAATRSGGSWGGAR